MGAPLGENAGGAARAERPVGVDGTAASFRRLAAGPDAHSSSYAELIVELQGFLDAFAAADLTRAEMDAARHQLALLRGAAAGREVPEAQRRFGRGRRYHTGVHAMLPEITTLELTNEQFQGATRIGDFFLGVNGAAHGGVVAMLLDEALGRLSVGRDRSPSRTAYLKTDFRALTPINVPLQLRARVDRIDGRKRFLRGEIWHGETLCAEANALFVELRPGQG